MRFKDMTQYEIEKMRRKTSTTELSAFARYCQALRGYEFYCNGRQIFKWELFDDGYRIVTDLLDNKTDIRAVYITDHFEI